MDNDQAGAEISTRATKARRRNISVALAIVVVIAIGVTAVVTTSGDNNSARSGSTYTPGDPLAWTAVEGGGAHTCALVNSGQVKCWGQNTYGQLGNWSNTDSYTPVLVSGIPTTTGATATSISLGYNHSCAVLSDGQVKCWGRNSYGQLGNGSNTNSKTPVLVSGIPTTTGATATSISTGRYHSCAVLSDGQVKCWGYNYYGQLGNGTNTDSYTPVLVSGIPTTTGATATSISLGYYHSCAVLSDGQVKCWGYNAYGQLGNGTNTNSNTPVPVTGIPTTTGATATSISLGYWYSCAVLSDGQVKCWGYNYYGQLGNGSNTNSNTPVPVTGISTATSISLGYFHSCAVLTYGQVKCWGDNGYGQLGNWTSTNSNTPVSVPSP